VSKRLIGYPTVRVAAASGPKRGDHSQAFRAIRRHVDTRLAPSSAPRYHQSMQPSSPAEKLELSGGIQYKRPPQPLHFPVEETVPESKRHLKLRTLLFQLLTHNFAESACIGSDQFVYWNARDPGRSLAPDIFVRLGMKDDIFTSWKSWERGTPELAIEIVSESDERDSAWDDKLGRYHELGIKELVRFDADSPEGQRLRIWDRLDNDLVERAIVGDNSPLVTLGLHWTVLGDAELGAVLRVAKDAEGKQLLPTPVEAEGLSRATESHARQAAERRVAELETELKKRGG
jgi:Uma2 family endonuclease